MLYNSLLKHSTNVSPVTIAEQNVDPKIKSGPAPTELQSNPNVIIKSTHNNLRTGY